MCQPKCDTVTDSGIYLFFSEFSLPLQKNQHVSTLLSQEIALDGRGASTGASLLMGKLRTDGLKVAHPYRSEHPRAVRLGPHLFTTINLCTDTTRIHTEPHPVLPLHT